MNDTASLEWAEDQIVGANNAGIALYVTKGFGLCATGPERKVRRMGRGLRANAEALIAVILAKKLIDAIVATCPSPESGEKS